MAVDYKFRLYCIHCQKGVDDLDEHLAAYPDHAIVEVMHTDNANFSLRADIPIDTSTGVTPVEEVITENNLSSTNNKIQWKNKITMQFIPYINGNYVLQWYCEYALSKKHIQGDIGIWKDSTLITQLQPRHQYSSNELFRPLTGFLKQVNLVESTLYIYKMKFKVCQGNGSITLRNAKLWIRRTL